MKKNLLKVWQSMLFAILAMAAISCETPVNGEGGDENKDDDPKVDITISNITNSHSDVTFEYEVPEDALVVGAVCVEAAKKDEVNTEYIFAEGKTASKTTGEFTFKNLTSETEYIIFVAYRGTNGFFGPVSKSFKTNPNSGDPATPQSAGVRVITSETDEIILEVINGSDVDFSLVMIDHFIAMDNAYLNYTYFGGTGTKEDYIRGFMSETSNGFLMFNTPGAGTVARLNYGERYQWPVYPDTEYSVFTFGCKGEWAKDNFEILDFSEIRFTTPSTPLIGEPFVDVETTKESYDFFAHQITPNADAAYWATFISTKDEIDYFINEYDKREGAGAGERRFNEFMRDYHKHLIPEQTQAEERRLNVGLSTNHPIFARYAVGFDENFVMGKKFDIAECQTKEVPTGPEFDAVYSMKWESPSATSAYNITEMAANCGRVFWDVKKIGQYSSALADPDAANEIKFKLYDEGYAVTRPYGTPQPAPDAPSEIFTDLHYGLIPGTEYEVVAIGSNYTGGLTKPKIVDTFTTKSLVLAEEGTYKPCIELTADHIGKTQVSIRYKMSEEGIEKDINNTDDEPRIVYHRIFDKSSKHEDDLAILGMSKDEMRMFLTGEGGNVWTSVSNDTDDENKYDYYWTWAAMQPNTPYVYYWVEENAKGEISDLGKCEFRTLSNTGGANPHVAIECKAEEITQSEYDQNEINMVFRTIPNDDVTYYNGLWYSKPTLDSYNYDTSNDQKLAESLLNLALSTGQAESVERQRFDVSGSKEESNGWFVVLTYGANGAEGPMSYLSVNYNDGDPIIGEQVNVARKNSTVQTSKMSRKSATPYYEFVDRINPMANMLRAKLRGQKVECPKRTIQEIHAELKALGLKTMGELSEDMLRSKGREELKNEL